jgi:hypothetical protein
MDMLPVKDDLEEPSLMCHMRLKSSDARHASSCDMLEARGDGMHAPSSGTAAAAGDVGGCPTVLLESEHSGDMETRKAGSASSGSHMLCSHSTGEAPLCLAAEG